MNRSPSILRLRLVPRAAFALLSIVLLSLAACERATPRAEVTPAPIAAPPPPIEVVPIVARPLDTSVRLEGELAPYESVAIFARVNAFVSKVNVDRGSTVTKGQVLATLVAPELTARRLEAEANARASRSNYDRMKAAARTPGAVAGNELDVAAARAAADDAKTVALRALEQYLTVSAPFDAVVTERAVHPGALVGDKSATPMLRLEHQRRLRLTVAVPEPLVGLVEEGREASFSVRSWPGERFTGVVRRSSRSLDTRTRTMAVELDVDNADRRLAPGMFAEVRWAVRREAATLFVPPSAIAESTERAFVVRVKDGVVEHVPVRRGATMGDLVEIVGRLGPGDLVARRGSDAYRPGARVEAVPPPR